MKKIIGLLFIFYLLFGCQKDMPTQIDGDYSFSAVLIDTTGVNPVNQALGYAPYANKEITLTSLKYYAQNENQLQYKSYTNSEGVIEFLNLPFSNYTLTSEIEKVITKDSITGKIDTSSFGIAELLEPRLNDNEKATIYFKKIKSGLVINEIYYVGSDKSTYYVYDMFIELYNGGINTIYLDGLMLCSSRSTNNPDAIYNDYIEAISVFQFPGTPLTGRQYPVQPYEFVVIAGDAIDHSQIVSNAPDLSYMPWEFFNPFLGEHDNPALNVLNILDDRTSDFLLNYKHSGVVLSDGSAWEYGEFYPSGDKQFINIPATTIIDAVELSINFETYKVIKSKLDAGFAGIGLVHYSGKSVRRKFPGFDTDNSTLDFEIINQPTPGKH